ncbi:uncharacterized protein N7500_008369 [Penicillium coprophilum]|uniref:uncharacterized protein n=1 Tax=Penicillium coprophilum TaxID=36646 RepID=UPI00239A940F|nr:uncharacterized protein N7500_008369 [Penicillium coprophilum]KAJ5158718.1 hypothetical protein N7500_008369 [Penicillium coprophilum]
MKTSLIALGALLGLVSAQNAVVHNHCATSVYVQSFPYDGSAPGPLTTVPKGELSLRNSEHLVRYVTISCSTVKIAKTKTLDKPLFFGYSLSSNPDYAYYELSTEWGNPFAANPNSLSPGDGCEVFDCAANDAACYSTPAHKKVYGCPQPVTLTADLCQ